MKMIIAINNLFIEKNITRIYYKKYNILSAKTKEEILNITSLKEEFLIITREDLFGKIGLLNFIEKIKEDNVNNRLVIIVKELTKELKEKLFSKEVFNIIEGTSFKVEELIDNIENPKLVIYKNKELDKKKNKIYCITGTRCSGKTTFTKMLAQLLAKDKRKRILAIDLDFIYPALDTYMRNIKNNSLSDLINDINNKNLKKIENYECVDLKYKNLKYILNNKSISIPNDNTVINMINILKEYYDYIVIDTSTIMINKIYSISKKVDFEIIYMLEFNLKSIREYLLDTSQIDNKLLIKTKFIINKSRKKKILINEIEKYLPNKIITIIPKYIFINYMVKNNMPFFKNSNFLKCLGVEKYKLKIIKKN